MQGFSKLEDSEEPHFRGALSAFLELIKTQHAHFAAGLIDVEQRERYHDNLCDLALNPGFVEW
jgi:hypothetical protein